MIVCSWENNNREYVQQTTRGRKEEQVLRTWLSLEDAVVRIRQQRKHCFGRGIEKDTGLEIEGQNEGIRRILKAVVRKNNQ